MFRKMALLSLIAIAASFLSGCDLFKSHNQAEDAGCADRIAQWRSERSSQTPTEKYADLEIIDAHNHDADKYDVTHALWDQDHVGQVALLGYVSREASVLTDELVWQRYSENPDRLFPYFAGVDIHSNEGVEQARTKLEIGYMGIGELAASSVSPGIQSAEWKADNAMEGKLPEIYELAGEYRVPVLLHNDKAVDKLEEALDAYPDTTFVFAHPNVTNSPEQIGLLMQAHPNLYIDFYAGYTEFNKRSRYKLQDYVGVIEKYPDRVFLATDSGAEIEYEDAIKAMYDLVDLLTPETACKVARGNFLRVMNRQPVTATQRERLESLASELGISVEVPDTKLEANKLIFQLTGQLEGSGGDAEAALRIPSVADVKPKSIGELSDGEMIAVARDLLTRLNAGLWSKDAETKAKDHWEEYYSSLYFPEAMSDRQQSGYRNDPRLNSYAYKQPSFENEKVEKADGSFVYTGEMKEIEADSEGEHEYHTLYRITVRLDNRPRIYKVSRLIGVEIKK